MMKSKVILISIDGMRPDGMQNCGNSYVKALKETCTYIYMGESLCIHPLRCPAISP